MKSHRCTRAVANVLAKQHVLLLQRTRVNFVAEWASNYDHVIVFRRRTRPAMTLE